MFDAFKKYDRCVCCGKVIPKIPASVEIAPPIFSRKNGKTLLILQLFVRQHTCGDNCYIQYLNELVGDKK